MGKNRKHYDLLDLYKFIAAILIICHHYQQIFGVKYAVLNFYGGRLYFGYLVELFFVISGFVAMNSLTGKQQISTDISFRTAVTKEIKHKALRIYPMTILACLFSLAVACCYKSVLGAWPGHTNYGSPRVIIESLLLVFRGWPKLELHGINNPMWYLCVLLLCYLIFYISNYICRKLKINYLVFIIAAYVFIEFGKYFPILKIIFSGDAKRGYEAYFLGVLLSIVIPHIKRTGLKLPAAVFMLSGVAILCWNMDHQRAAFLWLISPGLVMLACLFEDIKVPLWNTLAGISFEMYVWHVPTFVFLQLLNDSLNLNIQYNLIMMIVLLVYITIISTVMYSCVEKKINAWIRKRSA